jgi:hypothetical protein
MSDACFSAINLNNGVTNISRASLAKKVVGIAFRKAKQIPHHLSKIPGNAAGLFHNDMIVMEKKLQPPASGRASAGVATDYASRVL